MSNSVVNLTVNDSSFNAKIKQAINMFASLGSKANGASSQFSKFSDSVASVAQSQELLNTALRGNPYGMMVQAASAAFGKLIQMATEATDVQKALIQWEEHKAERTVSANEAIGNSLGNLMAQYETLRTQWLSLSSDQERNSWIKDNAKAFNSLNLAVKDVNSADEVFIKNSASVVAALQARAEAEAYTELYKDSIKKHAQRKASGEFNPEVIDSSYIPNLTERISLSNEDYIWKHRTRFNSKTGESIDIPYIAGLNPSGVAKIQQLRNMGATVKENVSMADAHYYANLMTEAQKRAAALTNNGLFGPAGGGGGGNSGNISVSKELTEFQINQKLINELTQEYVNISDDANEATRERQELIREEIEKLQKRNSELKLYAEQAGGKFLGGSVDTRNLGQLRYYSDEALAVTGVEKQPISLKGESNSNKKSVAGALSGLSTGMGQMVAGMEQLGIEVPEGIKDAISAISAVSSILTAISATIIAIEALVAADTFLPFSNGGVVRAAMGYEVPGNIGYDGVPSLLTSGEVVLNRAQQGVLASALQTGGLAGLQLEAVIAGEDIRLVINNNGRRTGRGEFIQTNFRG